MSESSFLAMYVVNETSVMLVVSSTFSNKQWGNFNQNQALDFGYKINKSSGASDLYQTNKKGLSLGLFPLVSDPVTLIYKLISSGFWLSNSDH